MAYGPSEFAKDLNALDINVPRGTLDRLETYAALLTKWQAKINLVGPATLPDLWRRHFLDSAQLVLLLNCLPQARGGKSSVWGAGTLVDLGSGAGFPGLVLAIMTNWRVHLIDSDQRKCAFLRQAALDCGMLDRVTIHANRIEQVTGIAADVVTARACAPLDELLGLAAPVVGEGGSCVFLKGAQAEEELTQAERHWTMRVEKRGSVSDPAGTILVITELRRKSQ
ncbi:16S rRNA (guanine(527)-N(7))-methyltransferase RsmG [Dongia deserti]|uniref:16S rRNA (guanine(527)-N(7))-methyltransferase RsmG n=1 Tax=Dongia deserti TaxID=2268030 RepID=UPI000E64B64E|nr:16S rRNA (guanine(527)-N(7))-methyltransferase RsmG [Dongia deserti]